MEADIVPVREDCQFVKFEDKKEDSIKFLENHINEEVISLNKLVGRQTYILFNKEKIERMINKAHEKGCRREATAGKKGEFSGSFNPTGW